MTSSIASLFRNHPYVTTACAVALSAVGSYLINKTIDVFNNFKTQQDAYRAQEGFVILDSAKQSKDLPSDTEKTSYVAARIQQEDYPELFPEIRVLQQHRLKLDSEMERELIDAYEKDPLFRTFYGDCFVLPMGNILSGNGKWAILDLSKIKPDLRANIVRKITPNGMDWRLKDAKPYEPVLLDENLKPNETGKIKLFYENARDAIGKHLQRSDEQKQKTRLTFDGKKYERDNFQKQSNNRGVITDDNRMTAVVDRQMIIALHKIVMNRENAADEYYRIEDSVLDEYVEYATKVIRSDVFTPKMIEKDPAFHEAALYFLKLALGLV